MPDHNYSAQASLLSFDLSTGKLVKTNHNINVKDLILIRFNQGVLMTGYPKEHALFLSPKAYITPQTKFFIGEISQQFTAYIALKILDKFYDKLTLKEILSMKIVDIFPDSKLLATTSVTWIKDITLEELITGKSNLPNYLEHCKELNLNHVIVEPTVIFNALNKVDTTLHTSDQESFCTNYYILAKLIEEFTRASYDQIFRKIMTEKRDLRDTSAPVVGDFKTLASQHHNLATNSATFEMANRVGSTNIISSAQDLVKWYQIIFEHKDDEVCQIITDVFYKNDESMSKKYVKSNEYDRNDIYPGRTSNETSHDIIHFAEYGDFGNHKVAIYHFDHSEDYQQYIVLLALSHGLPKVEHEVFLSDNPL